jgi:hypothetical protein
MDNNLIYYFSINDLLKNKDIINLIKNESFNSYEEFNTILWGNNNNIAGNIKYKVEIKNIVENGENNFYTDGVIIVLLNNSEETNEHMIPNIYYEIPIYKLHRIPGGCSPDVDPLEYGSCERIQNKINLFTDNYHTIIDYYYLNNIKLEQKIEINIESFIKENFLNENLFYSIISIKKI